MAGRDAAVARLGGHRAIPDDVARDAVLDELDPLLRRPLEVEALRHVGLVERVVGDRDLLVEDPLSDPAAEVAPLLEKALGAERVVREPAKQLCDGVRLEDGGVVAGLDLLGSARAGRLRRGFPGGCGWIDVRQSPVGLLGPAGSALDGREESAFASVSAWSATSPVEDASAISVTPLVKYP